MSKDTSGPAFPAGSVRKSRPAHDPGGDWVETDRVQPLHQGLSLRDYFAARALQGMLACPVQPQSGPDMYARDAYTLADAMLEARNTPSPKRRREYD